jgi:uncharacterized protein
MIDQLRIWGHWTARAAQMMHEEPFLLLKSGATCKPSPALQSALTAASSLICDFFTT